MRDSLWPPVRLRHQSAEAPMGAATREEHHSTAQMQRLLCRDLLRAAAADPGCPEALWPEQRAAAAAAEATSAAQKAAADAEEAAAAAACTERPFSQQAEAWAAAHEALAAACSAAAAAHASVAMMDAHFAGKTN